MNKIYIFVAKLIYFFIKLLKIGSGYTWPGHFLLLLNPSLLNNIKTLLPNKIICITGTNGKTTTSKLTTHLLSNNGFSVLHNNTGANLLNGIVSSILLSQSLFRYKKFDIAVLEVDEFTLPKLLEFIRPSSIAFLNLSRDQLDRHWELDIVLEKWIESLKNFKGNIILNKGQLEFKAFEKNTNAKIYYFGDEINYLNKTNLKGSYNAKNLNCAIKLIETLDVSVSDDVIKSVSDFNYAYGRGEDVLINNIQSKIFLAKNPASLDANLQMLIEGAYDYDSVLFILNDKVPDGHDVSWIYDINSELLFKACKNKEIFVSGTRFLDMAVRLQYSGVVVKEENIVMELSSIIEKIKSTSKNIHNLIIFPNYSAMLEIRKVLLGRKIL